VIFICCFYINKMMTERHGKKMTELQPVVVKIPTAVLVEIEGVVETGRYANRSEFIRAAIRKLLDGERRVR